MKYSDMEKRKIWERAKKIRRKAVASLYLAEDQGDQEALAKYSEHMMISRVLDDAVEDDIRLNAIGNGIIDLMQMIINKRQQIGLNEARELIQKVRAIGSMCGMKEGAIDVFSRVRQPAEHGSGDGEGRRADDDQQDPGCEARG